MLQSQRTKLGGRFFLTHLCRWRTGNVLGRNEVVAFFKVWEEAYVKVHSQKGDEKMEGVVLGNKHF